MATAVNAGSIESRRDSSEPRRDEPEPDDSEPLAPHAHPDGARRSRWTVFLGVVAVVGIVVVAGVALDAQRSLLHTAGSHLSHLNWGWLVLAIACQFFSMLAFSLLQRRLLLAAGATRVPLSALLATAYKANAICLGVPVFGSGMATSYVCGQFRKQGVASADAVLALGVAGVFSTVAFALVVASGALASGNATSAVFGLIGTLGLLTGVGVFLASLHWPWSRAKLEQGLAPVVRLAGRLRRKPVDDPQGSVAATFDRVRSLRLRPTAVAAASTYALVNWLTDALCLACAVLAVGPHLPWDRLLLVWGAGAGAGSLTPTPGGIGVVDVVLIAALVGTGVAVPAATAAVIVYRIITFKLLFTLAWVVFGSLHRQRAAVPTLTQTPS
jgi:putative heme transporter